MTVANDDSYVCGALGVQSSAHNTISTAYIDIEGIDNKHKNTIH